MYDVVQIGGSLLILGGFLAAMAGWVAQSSYMYLSLNAVGSAALTATAVISAEAGFILLEGVWALVSVFSIGRKLPGGPWVELTEKLTVVRRAWRRRRATAA